MAPRRSTRTSTSKATHESEQQHHEIPAKRSQDDALLNQPEEEHASKKQETEPSLTENGSVKEKNESDIPSEDLKQDEAEGGSKESEVNAAPGERASQSFFDSMGTKGETERRHGLLETGDIYFIYRPKVMVDEPESIDDVARLHILLVPKLATPPANSSQPHRLLVVGRKHLPYSKSSGRPDVMWGEVLEVGDNLAKLKERLGPSTYSTKTRGDRHIGAARVAGSGHYVLNCSPDNPAPKDSKNQSALYKTYLAYTLITPHEIGEVQEDFNIQRAAALHLQVKAPDAPSTNPAVRNAPESRKPKYTEALKKLFVTRYIPANPPSLLDYPGAELLFIPSKHGVIEDVGEEIVDKELDKTRIKKEEDGEEEHDPKAAQHAEEVLKNLGWEDNKEDIKALEGHWS